MEMTEAKNSSRRRLRSIGAVLAGFITVVVLSTGIDQILHVLGVYPSSGEPMYDTGLNMLALSYRIVITILGGYITARLAPHSPMRHALALGLVGTIAGLAAAIATIPMDLGPAWYPIALVLTALPSTWLGGVLHRTWNT